MRRASARLISQMDWALGFMEVLPFEAHAVHAYARIRNDLEKGGQPIGPLDTFIAAHALAQDIKLITANTGEFSRVPGLRIENWLD